MNSKKTLLAALLAALMLTSGCGSSPSQQQTDTAAQTGETGTSNVASASDMAEVEDVVEDSMIPIAGDQVKDGTYHVTVKSSSKMFDITACELTVDPDKVEIITDRFGKGATFLPFDGQQVRARVKVCKSQQFFGWVASMGRAVSIAAPQSLVEEYRDYLRFLLEE